MNGSILRLQSILLLLLLAVVVAFAVRKIIKNSRCGGCGCGYGCTGCPENNRQKK